MIGPAGGKGCSECKLIAGESLASSPTYQYSSGALMHRDCRLRRALSPRNISGHGALLWGIEQLLRCGDLIVVQYGKKRARFRVAWTRDSANGEKVRAAVQRLESEECPWEEELQAVAPVSTGP